MMRTKLGIPWWKQSSGEPKGTVMRTHSRLPSKPTLVKIQADTSGRTLLVYDEDRTFMKEYHGSAAESIMEATTLCAFAKTYVMAHFTADGDMCLDGEPLAHDAWPVW